MSQQVDRGKRPVSALLAGPYGHPFHPILVNVPIGAWVASFVFDVASHVVHDPTFLTRGSTWLIALGVLGALAAAVFGFLDLLAIPSGTRAYRTGLIHMTINVTVTVAYIINVLWRHSAATRGAVPIDRVLLSAVSLAALGVSGYLGGKLAFRYGVRVADEQTQREGFDTAPSTTGPSTRRRARRRPTEHPIQPTR